MKAQRANETTNILTTAPGARTAVVRQPTVENVVALLSPDMPKYASDPAMARFVEPETYTLGSQFAPWILLWVSDEDQSSTC